MNVRCKTSSRDLTSHTNVLSCLPSLAIHRQSSHLPILLRSSYTHSIHLFFGLPMSHFYWDTDSNHNFWCVDMTSPTKVLHPLVSSYSSRILRSSHPATHLFFGNRCLWVLPEHSTRSQFRCPIILHSVLSAFMDFCINLCS